MEDWVTTTIHSHTCTHTHTHTELQQQIHTHTHMRARTHTCACTHLIHECCHYRKSNLNNCMTMNNSWGGMGQVQQRQFKTQPHVLLYHQRHEVSGATIMLTGFLTVPSITTQQKKIFPRKCIQGWYSQSTLSTGKFSYRRATPYLP